MRVRTGYSFRAAVGHLPDVLSRLQECAWTVAPISDRLSTFGFTRWSKACAEAGLRPVYGVEVPCVVKLGEKKQTTDNWTFFAKDALRPLHDAINLATQSTGKEPALTYQSALATPGLIKVAGERLLTAPLPDAPWPDFYVALSPSTPKGLIKRALDKGLRFIASSDNYFPRQADLEFYRVALGRRASTHTYPTWLLTDHELADCLLSHEIEIGLIDQAFINRDAAMLQCQATLKHGKLLVPPKPQTLRAMCEAGAPSRGLDLSDPVYAARLDKELKLIDEKAFEDYFYVIADLVGWARERMVVGPARGSSCGSLVCYLLGITAIDPIPYGLIFERFIDINRMDIPDIDIDFSDKNRNKVFEYAEKKFGSSHVARLGTVGMFKARSAMKQAGNALRIPVWRTDKVADSIIERSSGDSRVMNSLEDTLNETEAGRAILAEYPELIISARMEGHPSVASQHAAGLLLTDESVTEYVAVDARTKAAWCDKKDAEELNLLKIDALGLTQLSVFERTLELMGEKPTSAYLDTIPLDDKGAFEVLNKGHYSGVFQFTGTALRSLAGQITFTELSDFVAMSALCRPGPLGSGGAMSWIKRKRGEERIAPAHPLLEELTRETYGVVIYQETVMRITREIGNFSWADTARIRKLMSGRMGEEIFNKFWAQFKKGALSNGLKAEEARLIWDQINTFGSWAFNKSHSVAYGVISYWCAWFKAHYPVEFAAATLDAESDPAKQISILRELAQEGIGYLPVDVDHSEYRWTVAREGNNTKLIGPLTAIHGIGPKKVQEIMDARRSGKPLRPGLAKQLDGAKTDIDSLFPIKDAIDRAHPDLTKINIFSAPTTTNEIANGKSGEVMILAMLKKASPRDENEAINIQKRGYAVTGPTQALNLWMADDTGEVYCRVDRFNFERIGRPVLEAGKAGKSLYAIKGNSPPGYSIIIAKNVRYLGEMS